jgi:DNA-binding CsgD family transcriptional regulator
MAGTGHDRNRQLPYHQLCLASPGSASQNHGAARPNQAGVRGPALRQMTSPAEYRRSPAALEIQATHAAQIRHTGLIEEPRTDWRVIASDPHGWQDAVRQVARGNCEYPTRRAHVICLPDGAPGRLASSWPPNTTVELRYARFWPPIVVIIVTDAAYMPPAVIRDPTTVAALAAMFDRLWEAAIGTTDPVLAQATDAPTPQELDVLRLLVQGLTQEAIARTLDLSVRTVRRRIADVSARLGAASLSQAVHEATQRGWLLAPNSPQPNL